MPASHNILDDFLTALGIDHTHTFACERYSILLEPESKEEAKEASGV